jgi:hypothetical protein
MKRVLKQLTNCAALETTLDYAGLASENVMAVGLLQK